MIKKIFSHLQVLYFPTEHQRVAEKYNADGGDNAFRYNYNLNEQSIVIDLGGYRGQWASDLFSMYLCNIIIFEPVESFAEAIKLRFRFNKKIKVFAFGLGANTRKEIIFINEDSSSIYIKASIEGSSIAINDVKAWFATNNIKSVDLMKVNIEGGEYELLEELIDSGLIKLVKNIQIQFHQISKDSDLRMQMIQEGLNKTHELTWQYRFIWENWEIKHC